MDIPLYLQVKLDFLVLFGELVHAEAQASYYLHNTILQKNFK